MSRLEERLRAYAARSSSAEKERQERAVRMVRRALEGAAALSGIEWELVVKGSYANGTNVRIEGDVDVAVVQKRVHFVEDSGDRSVLKATFGYGQRRHLEGAAFRATIEEALCASFADDCDVSGKTAITIRESSARVSADVVPSFSIRQYSFNGAWKYFDRGLTTLRSDGTWIVNFPQQQLEQGNAKNFWTFGQYKQLVRILKHLEDDLVEAGLMEKLASYFVECLAFNVPTKDLQYLAINPLAHGIRVVLDHIERATVTGGAGSGWVEANGIKPLFGPGQPWQMRDAQTFAVLASRRVDELSEG